MRHLIYTRITKDKFGDGHGTPPPTSQNPAIDLLLISRLEEHQWQRERRKRSSDTKGSVTGRRQTMASKVQVVLLHYLAEGERRGAHNHTAQR